MNLGAVSYSLISGTYSHVAVQGDVAFAATGYGIKIMDTSNPVNPVEIAYLPTNGFCKSVTVVGDYLLASDFGTGLLVYDVSDLEDIQLLDVLPLSGDLRYVCPAGDYLYVTAEGDGVLIVDFSDPQNLQLVTTLYTGGETFYALAYNNWLYVALGIAGMGVYDISDPEDPLLSLIWNMPGGKTTCMYLFPSADYLAVSDFLNGVYLLDMTHPWIPTWTSTCSLANSYATYVTGRDNFVACSYAAEGIQTFNASGNQLDYLEIGNKCGGVFAVGDYLYVSQGDSGLNVINSQTPSNLYSQAEYPLPGQVWNVEVRGNVAYVANMLEGLTVMNVANPAAPVKVESHPTVWWAKDVLVSPDGNHLYVADFGAGIQVYSLSDPLHPALVGTAATIPDTGAHGLVYRNGYLYVSNYLAGMNVFDVTDPTDPTLVYVTPDTVDSYREVAFTEDGQHIFAVAEDNGILVYTVIAPDSLHYEYTLTVCRTPNDICISGDYAYVADGAYGLKVLDVSNYAYVFAVDSLPTLSQMFGVGLLDENHLAIADYEAGVAVVNISNPLNISEIDRCETPGFALNVTGGGDYLYVSDMYELTVMDLYAAGVLDPGSGPGLPGGLVLHPAYPNPFNPATALTFELPAPQRVHLGVFDTQGRRVAVLADGWFSAGGHQVTFRPDNLASGIYFARLEAGNARQVQKLLYVK